MLHQQIRDHRATEAASTPANDTEQ